jgi:hypothetical protein
MVKVSKETKLLAEQIVSMASEFFGRNGLGLEWESRNTCCITLEGGARKSLVGKVCIRG